MQQTKSYTDTIFNWICDAPLNEYIKLPDKDKEKYENGIKLIKEWQEGGNFSVFNFCISFNEKFTCIIKYPIIKNKKTC